MIYRDFKGLQLSLLGMGCMRLPVHDGNDAQVNEAAVAEMVDYAMQHGVNYYDTAWGYHGGHSEAAVGKALAKYPRESFFLADKFPGYDLKNMDKVEEIFAQQLKRCGVEYFDFYMFHNVCEMNIDEYLDLRHGILPYLLSQKINGRIRHLGFSAHGALPVMRRFLEAYGEHMEFCQLQVNYVDWEFQQAAEKVALCTEYGLPVWVMEPLRGGQLVRLAEEDVARLRALRPAESQAGWAMRFLQGMPEVKVILSGMSDLAQMKENIAIFETMQPVDAAEKQTLLDIAAEMVQRIALPCTACHYCVSHCPQGLDIPTLLNLYNEHCFTGGGFIAPMLISSLPEDKRPAACLGCGSCEAVCPQQLKIAAAMADFAQKLAKK